VITAIPGGRGMLSQLQATLTYLPTARPSDRLTLTRAVHDQLADLRSLAGLARPPGLNLDQLPVGLPMPDRRLPPTGRPLPTSQLPHPGSLNVMADILSLRWDLTDSQLLFFLPLSSSRTSHGNFAHYAPRCPAV
jgi:hypothetical protein